MRVMTRKNLVCMAIILGLTAGVTACSDKKEEQSSQATATSAASTNTASQVAPTPAQQEAQRAAAAAQNIYVPAPLSPEQQLRVQQARAKHEVENEYTCKNGTKFKAVFARNPNAVAITFPGRVTVTLPKKEVPGLGFWYATDQYELRGRGPFAKWIMKGRDAVDCTVSVYEMTK